MDTTPRVAAIPPSSEATPVLRACLFSLGGSTFAVDVRSAREVAGFDEITRVPRAVRHLVGVANLRGTIVPIVDIRGALGLSEARPARSVHTLVVRDGSLVVAAVVDSVLGLESFDAVLPPNTPAASQADGPRAFATGWVNWVGEVVPVLDIPRLLAMLRSSAGAVAPAQEVA